MTNTAMVGFVIALTLLPCLQFGQAATPTVSLAEQEVIGVLLQHEGPTALSGTAVMLEVTSVNEIRRGRSYEDFAKGLKSWGLHIAGEGRVPEVDESREDFLAKNRLDTKIVFPTNAPAIRLVPVATVEGILRTNGWDTFYRLFPGSGGYAVVSHVGFSSNNTVAMVYFGVHRGPLSGKGRVYVLRRNNDKWTVTDEHIGPEWVS